MKGVIGNFQFNDGDILLLDDDTGAGQVMIMESEMVWYLGGCPWLSFLVGLQHEVPFQILHNP